MNLYPAPRKLLPIFNPDDYLSTPEELAKDKATSNGGIGEIDTSQFVLKSGSNMYGPLTVPKLIFGGVYNEQISAYTEAEKHKLSNLFIDEYSLNVNSLLFANDLGLVSQTQAFTEIHRIKIEDNKTNIASLQNTKQNLITSSAKLNSSLLNRDDGNLKFCDVASSITDSFSSLETKTQYLDVTSSIMDSFSSLETKTQYLDLRYIDGRYYLYTDYKDFVLQAFTKQILLRSNYIELGNDSNSHTRIFGKIELNGGLQSSAFTEEIKKQINDNQDFMYNNTYAINVTLNKHILDIDLLNDKHNI